MSREYGSATAFFDLLFNILCCFVVLFSISFLLMSRKIEEDRKIKANAEFMITVTWPKDSDDDVDTYVEDPLGNLVFFRRRDEGLMGVEGRMEIAEIAGNLVGRKTARGDARGGGRVRHRWIPVGSGFF